MKGHNTAMKIEVAQTTLHFFIAIMLNSPSKKNRYLNKKNEIHRATTSCGPCFRSPQKNSHDRQGTFQQAIELVDTHLTWQADERLRWFPNSGCGAGTLP